MNENVKPLTLICLRCHPLSDPPLAWRAASSQPNRYVNLVHSGEHHVRGAGEGGEHNRREGREMTRAFTVMRFPL